MNERLHFVTDLKSLVLLQCKRSLTLYSNALHFFQVNTFILKLRAPGKQMILQGYLNGILAWQQEVVA